MTDRNPTSHASRNNKRSRRRQLIWAVIITIVVSCILWLWGGWRDSRSADERLAEIQAARAIPDSINAAMIYNRLLQDLNSSLLLEQVPKFLHPDNDSQRFEVPWKSSDHTEAAMWIQAAQPIVDTLLEASGFEECRFPIEIDVENQDDQMDRNSAMRSWARFLRMAAYNDVAEGRTHDAAAKWLCVLQMGRHLRQQPVLVTHLTASALEAVALNGMVQYVLEGLATDSELERFESIPVLLDKSWSAMKEELETIEELTRQKLTESLNAFERVGFRFQFLLMKYMADGAFEGSTPAEQKELIYDQYLARVRVLHIVLALKRFHDENNRWPEHLDAIRASLSEVILTDPVNHEAFVYKQMGDSFRLYSKGVNKRDEEGRRETGSKEGEDDWVFWPQ